MLGLSWGGRHYLWLSREILGLVGASALLWALFALRQRTAREPLIPLDVLRNPVVRSGTLAACFGMGVYIGLTIYLPIYFEGVRGMTSSQSGLCLIPLMLGTVVGATTSGNVMARFRHYKRLPTAGLLVAMAGTGVLAAFAQELPLLWLELILAAISVGLGTLLPVTTVSIQNAVVPYQLGTATGAMNFFRQLGGALIVALFGVIVLGGAAAGTTALARGTLVGAAADTAALAGSFRWVFAAALMGFAFALAFLIAMEERPLRSSAAEPDTAGAD
jgi:predicted MFS family arabinose efflux permease